MTLDDLEPKGENGMTHEERQRQAKEVRHEQALIESMIKPIELYKNFCYNTHKF